MENKHVFSTSYVERKAALVRALRRESALEAGRRERGISRLPIKILASAAILSVLTISVCAAAQWIEFRMEQKGDEVHIHAGLPQSGEQTEGTEKPLRSWNAAEGEIGICLNIPDLPADMHERGNTSGKYASEDSSRAMTINGIDLRRSDLDQIIGGVADAVRLDAGGKALYLIKGSSDASFYNRTAYLVFEAEELVLKFWVSYGITDDELLALASTLTLEETADTSLALPILNEVGDTTGNEEQTVYYFETSRIDESDLIEVGESVRDDHDWYTVTVNGVDIYDHINVLNPSGILKGDFVRRFTDAAGNLIPYNRTEKIYTQEGNFVSVQFGETMQSKKMLVVVTMTLTDLNLEEFAEEDRAGMLEACVNGYSLYRYTVRDGEVELVFPPAAVVDRSPEAHADSSEIIYREYLGNDRWKVAYLIDEELGEGDLMLEAYTGKIYIKLQ